MCMLKDFLIVKQTARTHTHTHTLHGHHGMAGSRVVRGFPLAGGDPPVVVVELLLLLLLLGPQVVLLVGHVRLDTTHNAVSQHSNNQSNDRRY